jgi:uncharacterized protein YbaP (TraB family)
MKIIIILALLFEGLPFAYAKPPIPLLWRVSDADNSVYLLGSMHFLKPGDYPLDAVVGKAFDDAEKVYFEIPPEEANNPVVAEQMFKLGANGNSRTLQQNLKREVWNRLKAYCRINKIPLATFQPFKPWLAGLIISVAEMEKSGLKGELSLDRYFQNQARKKRKKIGAFETLAGQFAFFDQLATEEQEQFLDETLKQVENPQYIEDLHRLWRNGDADGMWQMTAVEMVKKAPQFYRSFLVDRNNAWLPRISDFLQQNSHDDALVVVGSLHLLGEDGLIALLKKQGYRVDRLP